ncbi:hypothetical protein AVEN_46683-1 [Araneus ventricosus]|uniref:Uncharacterized protein n=1 Tax=Araneus ventricosus TaxID=182803 RepID=A0A4Y2NKM8_ARAVE|nr:hypothetical protein AVEN_46683-1 [Araneus ventricosus]
MDYFRILFPFLILIPLPPLTINNPVTFLSPFPGRTAGSNKKGSLDSAAPHRRKDNKASGCTVALETTTQEVASACAAGFVLMPASHLSGDRWRKEVKVAKAFSLTPMPFFPLYLHWR